MNTQHTPEPLISALRQYKHNDGTAGFVCAYDKDLTDKAFIELKQQRDELTVQNADLLDEKNYLIAIIKLLKMNILGEALPTTKTALAYADEAIAKARGQHGH